MLIPRGTKRFCTQAAGALSTIALCCSAAALPATGAVPSNYSAPEAPILLTQQENIPLFTRDNTPSRFSAFRFSSPHRAELFLPDPTPIAQLLEIPPTISM